MQRPEKLAPEALYRSCDPERLSFESTAELEDLDGALGQPRAVSALDFGISMERAGYNLFIHGPYGTGRHRMAREALEKHARQKPPPDDWCYVHDFAESRRAKVLRLPAGTGSRLRADMEQLVEELRTSLTGALESEEYQTRRQMIEEEIQEQQSLALQDVQAEAEKRGVRMIQSPVGIVFAPVRDGEVLPPEEIQKLSQEERKRLEGEIGHLQEEIQKALRAMPRWQRQRRDALRELNRQVTRFAVGAPIEELRSRYREHPAIVEYLDAVEQDVVENARELVGRSDGDAGHAQGGPMPPSVVSTDEEHPFLRRYRVNLIVDHRDAEGAPVVEEDHPTHANLIGRTEHIAQLGALVTDFNLIRAGALHRANGGYLLLDALELLRQPYAWDGLKRALRAQHLKIESIGEAFSLVHTVSLEPESIPLEVKVVLIGEPWIYYMLSGLDPDFRELFKVAADFDDRMERDPGSEESLARRVAGLARREELLPFDRDAVARTVEHAARIAGDSERLSLEIERLQDLLREADHWARRDGSEHVQRAHVVQALEAKEFRSDRIRQRIQEEIRRGTLSIATEGSETGQINGLSVMQLGDLAFGRPSRITARVRLGSGKLIDIEREVELSGPLHSKGVLILAGFLGERYAAETPLSLSASLVFEQSYGGVDGDSASSAELYALVSAIARVPLAQGLAVTGAIDQHGRVQAIGGVNEKIEGFFDVCQARGLSGEQGVLIPATNQRHLMLKQPVIDAVAAGQFAIYPVATVDQGLELLTGLPAGERDGDGRYPAESLNGRVQSRLAELVEQSQRFARSAIGEGSRP